MDRIIVIVGPSGSGKTVIVEKIVKEFPDFFRKVITNTTRNPRPGEKDGVDYNFVKEFNPNDYVEYTQYAGNFYGTSKKELEKENTQATPVLIMDINGVNSLKKVYPSIKVVSVFIDRNKELLVDAINRRNIPDEDKKKRIEQLDSDYLAAEQTTYVLKNDGTLEDAVKRILKYMF